MSSPYRSEALERATFLERPNRFIAMVERDGEPLRTYIANPGKLNEILLPGQTEVLLAHKPHTKTKWESVGAVWQSRWEGDGERAVFLNTGRVNDVADAYLSEGLVPGMEDYEVLDREVTVGDSRFDFLMGTPEGELLLEVKSVTLVEEGMALFPDARSKRAVKHVRELIELNEEGRATGVLFVVQGDAQRFLPDLHNDLEFARALREASEVMPITAVAAPPRVGDEDRLVFPEQVERLEMPWEKLDAILEDAGLYLAVLRVDEAQEVEIGALGTFEFEPGFYTYVGSAKKGLSKRMRRHKRTRKRVHWHIDYLRNAAEKAWTYPIRGAVDESALADAMAQVGRRFPAGFGATDCEDEGHLVHTEEDPIHLPEVQSLLTQWRHRRVFEQ